MKIIRLLIILCVGLTVASCNEIDTSTPDFSVSINKNTFAVGDTAKFNISGAPANIVFYSGESGNSYDTRNTFVAEGGIPEMTFNTALTTLAGSSTATNLSVLVSNNFNGNYTQTEVLAATWTDVTSLVTIPGTNQRLVLTPYVALGKPLYIAFRFQTTDPTKTQRLVTVSNFSFKTVYPNQTYQNAINVYNAGFAAFDFAGAEGKWVIPITSTSNTTFTHPVVAAGIEADNDWAISKPMQTNAVLPSLGITLKSISNDVIKNYQYKFTIPGTYKVTFVASNNTNSKYKETIKEFTITVN